MEITLSRIILDVEKEMGIKWKQNDNVAAPKTLLVYPDTGANNYLLGPLKLRKVVVQQEYMAPVLCTNCCCWSHLYTLYQKIKFGPLRLKTEKMTYLRQKKSVRLFLSGQTSINL